MRTEYSQIIKGSGAYKRIIKDIRDGNFCHAYLIVTEDSLAADALLTEICLALYCKKDGCGSCSDCQKVLKGIKPDLKEPNKDGEALKTEDIDSVVSDSYLTAFERCPKLYVLRNLENTSERAQNKLLKTLEEPSSNVHFLLTAASVQGILPTVASRVKQVALGAFGEQELFEVLTQKGVDNELSRVFSRSAQGSLTIAARLASDTSYFEKADMLIDILLELKRSEDAVRYIMHPVFANELADIISILELIFEDLLYINVAKAPPNFANCGTKLRVLSEEFNERTIAACLNCLAVSRQKLRANCIMTNIVDSLLISILEVRNKCV